MIAEELEKKGVILDIKGNRVNSLTQWVMISVLGTVAELEIKTLDEKHKTGMKLPKENCKHIVRKADLTLDNLSVKEAIKKYQEGKIPVTLICEQHKINRMKFYRLLKRHGISKEMTL